MTDQLISFKTSKIAKEKGFNEKTYFYYDGSFEDYESHLKVYKEIFNRDGPEMCKKHFRHNYPLECAGILPDGRIYGYNGNAETRLMFPTQSILQRWLREKHGHHIVLIPTVTAAWTYKTVRVISKIDDDVILGLKSVDELPPYTKVCGEDFRTYEDALEHALYSVLILIK